MDTSVTENVETVEMWPFSNVINFIKDVYIVYNVQSTSYLSSLNKGWLRSQAWETGIHSPQ